MKIFNVPADFKFETILKYKEINSLNERIMIHETYGQLTEGYMIKSGRVKNSLPKVNIKMLENYVHFSIENGIKFNYTLNPACLGNTEYTKEGIKELKYLLNDLYNIGVRNLTITSPALIELIQTMDCKFNIKVSAINHVDSITKLNFYKNLGVQRVVIEPDLHRNFQILRDMVELFGGGLEIIVNDICYKNCPYKIFHYNHEAHVNDQMESDNYFFMRCGMQKSGDFANYLKLNWIRPEDINLYEKVGIHNFKIQGRPYIVKGDIIKVLMCYAKEWFEGNLLDLLHLFAPYDSSHQPYIDNRCLDGFVEGFFNKTIECTELCSRCGYCSSFAKKSINESKDKLEEAKNYYRVQDSFAKLVKIF